MTETTLDRLLKAVETGKADEEFDRTNSSVARVENWLLTTEAGGWKVEFFPTIELAEENFADYKS